MGRGGGDMTFSSLILQKGGKFLPPRLPQTSHRDMAQPKRKMNRATQDFKCKMTILTLVSAVNLEVSSNY
jgi:hypothetical protein